MNGWLYPRLGIVRLYSTRNEAGSGLIWVEDCMVFPVVDLDCYVGNNEEAFVKAVRVTQHRKTAKAQTKWETSKKKGNYPTDITRCCVVDTQR